MGQSSSDASEALPHNLRHIFMAVGFRREELSKEIYSTHRRASNNNIRLSTAAAAQEVVKACRDNTDKWVVTTDARQHPIRLTVGRTAEDAAKARLALRAAWLLRQTGLLGARAEISTGRISDYGDKQLSDIDRATGPRTLSAFGERPGAHFGDQVGEEVARGLGRRRVGADLPSRDAH